MLGFWCIEYWTFWLKVERRWCITSTVKVTPADILSAKASIYTEPTLWRASFHPLKTVQTPPPITLSLSNATRKIDVCKKYITVLSYRLMSLWSFLKNTHMPNHKPNNLYWLLLAAAAKKMANALFPTFSQKKKKYTSFLSFHLQLCI